MEYAKELKTTKYEYQLFPLAALSGNKAEITKNIASYLSEKDIEEVINENKQFVSKEERKEKVKLLDSEITQAKQFVEENETVKVTTIDARKSSWAKLVEQYNCLDDIIEESKAQYPNIRNKNNTSLKIRL